MIRLDLNSALNYIVSRVEDKSATCYADVYIMTLALPIFEAIDCLQYIVLTPLKVASTLFKAVIPLSCCQNLPEITCKEFFNNIGKIIAAAALFFLSIPIAIVGGSRTNLQLHQRFGLAAPEEVTKDTIKRGLLTEDQKNMISIRIRDYAVDLAHFLLEAKKDKDEALVKSILSLFGYSQEYFFQTLATIEGTTLFWQVVDSLSDTETVDPQVAYDILRVISFKGMQIPPTMEKRLTHLAEIVLNNEVGFSSKLTLFLNSVADGHPFLSKISKSSFEKMCQLSNGQNENFLHYAVSESDYHYLADYVIIQPGRPSQHITKSHDRFKENLVTLFQDNWEVILTYYLSPQAGGVLLPIEMGNPGQMSPSLCFYLLGYISSKDQLAKLLQKYPEIRLQFNGINIIRSPFWWRFILGNEAAYTLFYERDKESLLNQLAHYIPGWDEIKRPKKTIFKALTYLYQTEPAFIRKLLLTIDITEPLMGISAEICAIIKGLFEASKERDPDATNMNSLLYLFFTDNVNNRIHKNTTLIDYLFSYFPKATVDNPDLRIIWSLVFGPSLKERKLELQIKRQLGVQSFAQNPQSFKVEVNMCAVTLYLTLMEQHPQMARIYQDAWNKIDQMTDVDKAKANFTDILKSVVTDMITKREQPKEPEQLLIFARVVNDQAFYKKVLKWLEDNLKERDFVKVLESCKRELPDLFSQNPFIYSQKVTSDTLANGTAPFIDTLFL